MKKKTLAVALTAALLAASGGPALAQPGDRDRGHNDRGHDQGHDRGRGPGPGDHRGPDRGPRHDRPDPQPMRWKRGDHVPAPYRGPQYVISDWRGHHLRQPPRGYHWVNTGADYFLIGIATGVVLESVLGQ